MKNHDLPETCKYRILILTRRELLPIALCNNICLKLEGWRSVRLNYIGGASWLRVLCSQSHSNVADTRVNEHPPLLPELHLLHDGLDVLHVVLLLPHRTLGLLQGPRLLAAHLFQHHRPLLTQRRQASLCNEGRRGVTLTDQGHRPANK